KTSLSCTNRIYSQDLQNRHVPPRYVHPQRFAPTFQSPLLRESFCAIDASRRSLSRQEIPSIERLCAGFIANTASVECRAARRYSASIRPLAVTPANSESDSRLLFCAETMEAERIIARAKIICLSVSTPSLAICI